MTDREPFEPDKGRAFDRSFARYLPGKAKRDAFAKCDPHPGVTDLLTSHGRGAKYRRLPPRETLVSATELAMGQAFRAANVALAAMRTMLKELAVATGHDSPDLELFFPHALGGVAVLRVPFCCMDIFHRAAEAQHEKSPIPATRLICEPSPLGYCSAAAEKHFNPRFLKQMLRASGLWREARHAHRQQYLEFKEKILSPPDARPGYDGRAIFYGEELYHLGSIDHLLPSGWYHPAYRLLVRDMFQARDADEKAVPWLNWFEETYGSTALGLLPSSTGEPWVHHHYRATSGDLSPREIDVRAALSTYLDYIMLGGTAAERESAISWCKLRPYPVPSAIEGGF